MQIKIRNVKKCCLNNKALAFFLKDVFKHLEQL